MVKKQRLIIIISLGFYLMLGIFHFIQKSQPVSLNKKNRITSAPTIKPSPTAIPRPASIHLPIIMYHYVEYVKDPGDTIRKSLDIVPSAFEAQLKVISEGGYKTYFVKEIPDILLGKTKYDNQGVILSFDDGYEDFYTSVLPLLKKYNVKATLYIVLDFIGRKGFLNEKELNEIVSSGLVEIGSHTLNHRYLKLLPIDIQRKEIVESRQKLEELLKTQIVTFAYPYGAYDNNTVELVKEASYSAAVSTIKGEVQSENSLFLLYRIRAGGTVGDNMIKLIKGSLTKR